MVQYVLKGHLFSLWLSELYSSTKNISTCKYLDQTCLKGTRPMSSGVFSPLCSLLLNSDYVCSIWEGKLCAMGGDSGSGHIYSEIYSTC
jgi:hypothetical protein